MNRFLIEYQDKSIFISGNHFDLLKINYVRVFLNEFDYIVQEDKIVIPNIEKDDFPNVYQEIKATLEEEGFCFGVGDNLDREFESFLSEEKKFDVFSEKARDIRDNKIVNSELEAFLTNVKINLKNRVLYRLQYLSAYHLAFSQNACNFSVPGAGKTSIVYAAYSYLKNLQVGDAKKVDKILVICPISAFGPWHDEYVSCFGEEPSVQRISGEVEKNEKSSYFYSSNCAELTLISYHSTINLTKSINYFLRNNNVLMILDEAHKIKNTNGGIIAKTILDLCVNAKARFVLTGTPVPNSYGDLYNIFKFIWPNKDILKYTINQLENMTSAENDVRVNSLIDSIKPFYIRIRKKDLDNMPIPIEHSPILIQQSDNQKIIYDFIFRRFAHEIDDYKLLDIKKSLMKAKLIRLMQAASNPALLSKPINEYMFNEGILDEEIDNGNVMNLIKHYYETEVPPKFVACMSKIIEILERNEKVVVWTTFVENLNKFSEYLNNNGISNLTIYGETPIEKTSEEVVTREEIINQFKKSSIINVLITNPFAVSESISLHKQCHNAIYFERTFNAAHFMQSKDRIHRYGLKKDDVINYYYLVTEGTIDEKVHEILLKKVTRMTEIIESEEIPLFKNLDDDAIDDESLMEIMRSYEEH